MYGQEWRLATAMGTGCYRYCLQGGVYGQALLLPWGQAATATVFRPGVYGQALLLPWGLAATATVFRPGVYGQALLLSWGLAATATVSRPALGTLRTVGLTGAVYRSTSICCFLRTG